MEKFHKNLEISNINIHNNIKEIVTVKTYKYCIKCLKDLPEDSLEPWCDQYCKNEYFAEQRKEADACYREWCGY